MGLASLLNHPLRRLSSQLRSPHQRISNLIYPPTSLATNSTLSSSIRPMCMLHNSQSGPPPPNRQVLPPHVVPQHYRVFLHPNLTKFTYSGSVEIDLCVKTPTDQVSLNILDLKIHQVSLNGDLPTKTSTCLDSQTITFAFPAELRVGAPYTLKVKFDGELNDEMAGFYRSVHKDKHGNDKVMATTQMESTDCRRAFPCFDEPALKATFDIAIRAKSNLTVLSNSDVKLVEKHDNGECTTYFSTTPLMSSYLVAFVVGELQYVESRRFRVPIRVYAEDGDEEKCQYAADLAADTLQFFENTFGIEYPMPKCDMVGVHSFASGAMENWGLITYRLVDLFYQPSLNSAKTKMRVTEVVQHELAHQWFGNLVTMEWWDGLWLNEGFATWMSWYAANHFFPDWKVWETYMNEAYAKCMDLDALRNSHPVEVPIDRADQVPEIFDLISYLKGSCIIRMVSQYLGEEEFIKGISLYLNRHKYANTTTDDLWQALSDHSKKDVKGFLNTWVRETGYPTVVVGEQTGHKVSVRQHRFLNTGQVSPAEDAIEYPVWLGVRQHTGEIDREQMLLTKEGVVDVGSSDGFYKLNANQNGLYRVTYPNQALERIAEEGKRGAQSKLSVEDRIGVIFDLAAQSGLDVSATQLLSVAKQWENDLEPNVINAIRASLESLRRRLFFETEKVPKKYAEFASSVLRPFIKRVGYTGAADENIRITSARSEVYDTLVLLNDEETVKHAQQLFREQRFRADPNLMPGVFRAVARHGSEEDWRDILEFYFHSESGASGLDALEALGNTENEELIRLLLRKVANGTIKEQEVYRAIGGLAKGSPKSLQITIDYVTCYWDTLRQRFPVMGTTMGRIVRDVFGSCTKPEQLASFDNLLKNRSLAGIERAVGQARDEVQGSINALEHDVPKIAKWLDKNKV